MKSCQVKAFLPGHLYTSLLQPQLIPQQINTNTFISIHFTFEVFLPNKICTPTLIIKIYILTVSFCRILAETKKHLKNPYFKAKAIGGQGMRQ